MEQLPTILGALGTFLIVLGGGIKWILSHIEAKIKESSSFAEKARNELQAKVAEEISSLKTSIMKLESLNSIYMRRIYTLESFIHKQPGIDIPDMQGWPP